MDCILPASLHSGSHNCGLRKVAQLGGGGGGGDARNGSPRDRYRALRCRECVDGWDRGPRGAPGACRVVGIERPSMCWSRMSLGLGFPLLGLGVPKYLAPGHPVPTKYKVGFIFRRKINHVMALGMLGHQPGPMTLFFSARPAQLCHDFIFLASTRPGAVIYFLPVAMT